MSGVIAAGGIAYAAVELPTAVVPEAAKGSSVVEIGNPGRTDKWLNVSVTYRCVKGEKFVLRDDVKELLSATCDRTDQSTVEGGGTDGGGLMKSFRLREIRGSRLVMTSNLTQNYVVSAVWGERALLNGIDPLPADGPDGKPGWKFPNYEVNEYGLTVGPIYADSPQEAWPDLWPVSYKGEDAYFLTSEMRDPIGGTSAEQRKLDRERKRLGLDVDGKTYQFVYAADGKTRLGKKYTGSYSSNSLAR